MNNKELDKFPSFLGLLPPGAVIDDNGEIVVAGCRLSELATAYGTPLYVVDEGGIRRIRRCVR